MIEEKVRDHWKGVLPVPTRKRKKQAPVSAFEEDLFADLVREDV